MLQLCCTECTLLNIINWPINICINNYLYKFARVRCGCWKRCYPRLSHQLLSTDSARGANARERLLRCMFRYTRVVINSQSTLAAVVPGEGCSFQSINLCPCVCMCACVEFLYSHCCQHLNHHAAAVSYLLVTHTHIQY